MIWIRLILLLMACLTAGTAWSAPRPLSVALYYAADPPVDELQAFDIVVTDPDNGMKPSGTGVERTALFAYVSVGEADPNRSYTRQMDPHWLIGDNKSWNSRVVDVSSPAWRAFFLDTVIEPLWQAGYRGFFLDTLDSYQLAAGKSDFPRMEEGLAAMVRAIRQRHPEARLILNRGFEIFERVKDVTFAVAAESLFQRYDPDQKVYVEVPEQDRQWLAGKLNEVQRAGVPAIAIDYVPPADRDLTRRTAEKIKSLGFSPWVTDKDLATLGIGTIEVMPRKILGLYDSAASPDPYYSTLNRLAAMPLNYLGYIVELHDLREPLPARITADRYAGVVIWPMSDTYGKLREWVLERIAGGVRVVFLERFGFVPDSASLQKLGLIQEAGERPRSPMRIVAKDPRIGFEQQPLPQSDLFRPLKLEKGTSLLKVSTSSGMVGDAAAITPWGGYVFDPYVIAPEFGDQTAWIVDPFRFFKDALRLPDMPVPDSTTENGVRLLLSHVDGDGFESRAEWPGGRLAAEELRINILERYRLPVSVSVITSSLAPNGLHPEKSPQHEKIAREIFALPWVEGASHTFSHPYRWQPDQSESGEESIWHKIDIPGYTFNLEAEIAGSLKYINEQLMPPGKKARLLHWTGNCVPGDNALRLIYQNNILAINGGDTVMNESNRTVTRVAPLGIFKKGGFQVFAPNQNENVYTSLWSENFYGYRRVLETFRLTDLPRRLKPVNIYYHIYSATKEASLNSLRQVHEWALGQRLFAIPTSEYIEKVLDFNRTVVARDGAGWLVRNSGAVRELRIPRTAGFPDLNASRNVAGFSDHGASRYLHLMPGGEARVLLTPEPPVAPYLASAGGYLEMFERTDSGLKLTLRGHIPFRVRIGNSAGCRFVDTPGTALPGTSKELSAELPEGKHALAITCR